jgi:DNA-binding transcriptional ArsR family regulator
MAAKTMHKTESAQLSEIASIFSDSTRVRILTLLVEAEQNGETTSDIVSQLGVLQPRISSHLSILRKYGLIRASKRGRQRIYFANSKKVVPIMRDFAALASQNSRTLFFSNSKPARAPKSDSQIRLCRSCYDHLAGIAGVELLDQILHEGWLYEDKGNTDGKQSKTLYIVSESGLKALRNRGVDIDAAMSSNRLFAYGCVDWTERRPHLGGSLGSVVLDSILSRDYVERMKGTRALKLVKPISTWIEQPFRA